MALKLWLKKHAVVKIYSRFMFKDRTLGDFCHPAGTKIHILSLILYALPETQQATCSFRQEALVNNVTSIWESGCEEF
jgi:hypothetical protein